MLNGSMHKHQWRLSIGQHWSRSIRGIAIPPPRVNGQI